MNNKNSIIRPNVKLGKNVRIDDFCILGVRSNILHDLATYIGDNSHIRSGTYIYEGNKIGKNFHSGNKVNIRENNIIGNNVSIGTSSVIEHNVEIHDNVRIHSNVFIPEFTILKSGSWIGPNVVITNAKYPNQKNTKKELQGVIIEKNSVVGANVTILPGITVGENTIIGAGSVVTKNVIKNQIVAGNPAKFIRKNI